MPFVEMAQRVIDPTTPAIELIVAKIIQAAIQKGDDKRLGFIIDRLIGKVAERHEFTGSTHSALVAAMKLVQPKQDKNE